ncbi:hypothetical protein F4803DRAFT_544596 [Xylaria telfairii]|nr:hypothetical protein F4803DRAFT_544596 [Xylaria telfairii]
MLGRTLFAWTAIGLASLANVAFATDLSDVDLATVPQCGLLCIVNTVTQKSNCSLTDFPCICANKPLNDAIEACFTQECTPREALTTAKIAKELCGLPKRSRKMTAWVVPLVFVILSTIFYLTRLLSRVVLHQGVDLADIILGVSVGATFPVLWAAFTLAEYGLGQDIWEIPQDNITKILYLYWWAEILYIVGLPLTRISILCFYLRVFPQQRIRWATFLLIGLNVAYLIAFIFATVFQCYPVYGAWTLWDGTFTGHCNNIHVQSWVQAALNIFLDLLVIILPLPPLAGLTASRQKKVQIMIMFSFGFIITIISIIRLKTLVVFANSTNISYDYVDPGLYSVIEASISIIVCCLPAVRALLSTVAPTVFAATKNASVFSSGKTPKTESSHQRSHQRFNRLDDAYSSADDTRGPIRVQQEWQVHRCKKSESNVELMPMRLRGTETHVETECRVEAAHEDRNSNPRILNWSRPLPNERENGYH